MVPQKDKKLTNFYYKFITNNSQRKPAYKSCTEKFTARGMSQPPWCRKAVKSIELTFT